MSKDKVIDIEEKQEEEVEQGKIELSASINADGNFEFSATEGIHPMFLVGLLQYCISNLIDSAKGQSND